MRLPRFPHRGVALVVSVPLVAAVLTSCAATTYDQTLAPDTAAVTTTTQPSGSAADLLPQLAAASASLSGVMIAGDDAEAVREQIDALWAAARDEVRTSRPDLLDGFDQAVALVDKAVRFKRAADADKAARNLAILVETFLA